MTLVQTASSPPRKRVPLGTLFADAVTAEEAWALIIGRARSGEGGYVVTPNVDHLCVAAEHQAFGDAHRSAFLSLVDGTPLLWLAKLSGQPLPEKISGSDLVRPISKLAAEEGLRVALFGASPEASHEAHDVLCAAYPALNIVAREFPIYQPNPRPAALEADLRPALDRLIASNPDIVFVAMGTPNQELFMAEFEKEVPGIMLGIGAGLDFVSGNKKRAPQWAQSMGVEWLVRLAQEPRRMWRRYLVRDLAFFMIAPRQIVRMRLKKSQ